MGDIESEIFYQSENKLDNSIENEKEKNDFLKGVPAIVQALKDKKLNAESR